MTTQTKQLYEAAKDVCKLNSYMTRGVYQLAKALSAYEQSQQEPPVAYEFHNLTTGHCYVDYIPRIDMDEKNGYTKTPLYK